MTSGFLAFKRTESFKSDYKKLDLKQQQAVDECLLDLAKPVIPSARRFHCVDNNKPKIFTVDLYANKSYKISREIDGRTATLRRVATHKAIDDRP